MIFPTTYINNPASMFGHTLIRIDKENSFKNNSFINSIIINYGADTMGETSGTLRIMRKTENICSMPTECYLPALAKVL